MVSVLPSADCIDVCFRGGGEMLELTALTSFDSSALTLFHKSLLFFSTNLSCCSLIALADPTLSISALNFSTNQLAIRRDASPTTTIITSLLATLRLPLRFAHPS